MISSGESLLFGYRLALKYLRRIQVNTHFAATTWLRGGIPATELACSSSGQGSRWYVDSHRTWQKPSNCICSRAFWGQKRKITMTSSRGLFFAERPRIEALRARDFPLEASGARPHGDELLRRGRVQGHGRVEVGLAGSHFDGNSQQLRHFGRILAEDMDAKDAIGQAINDNLHHDFFRPPGKRCFQGTEVRHVNIDAIEDRARLRLGQPDGSDLRRRKNGRRNIAMRDGLRLIAKNRVGESMSLADGNRCELNPVGDIADGVDRINIGLGKSIDLHCSKFAACDASLFETQTIRVRVSARCNHDLINIKRHALRQTHVITRRRLFNAGRQYAEIEFDTRTDKPIPHPAPQIIIKTAQNILATRNKRNIRPKPREYGSEFNGDVSAADYQQALWQ